MNPRYPWTWGSISLMDWDVRLSPAVPIALSIESASSQSSLELRDLRVTELTFEVAASSMDVVLPGRAGRTACSIEAAASSVDVHVPDGVAAAIHAESSLGSVEVDPARFPVAGQGEYRSPDYDTSPNRVDIRVTASIGSVTIA